MSESLPPPVKTTAYAADAAPRLDSVNQTGNWIAWTGFFLAFLWWAGAGYGLYALTQTSSFSSLTPELLVAAAGLIFLTGLILLFASFMARQNRRTHETNKLLLQASEHLLSPARETAHEMQTLAETARQSANLVNHTSTTALASMKQVSEQMEAERRRTESVGYAMADNARDLTERLAQERTALESFSRTLGEQAALMGAVLPKQAEAMQDATRQARTDIDAAGAGLTARVDQLKQVSGTLATRLVDLDAVARDAATRTDRLHATIARIEEDLARSQKTVEMAERASTMAVDAAAQTGNALKDAISSALDSARQANQEIAHTTKSIQESARSAMEDLRETGAMAASTAARVQEQSLSLAADERETTSSPETAPPPEVTLRPHPEAITLDDIRGFSELAFESTPQPLNGQQSISVTRPADIFEDEPTHDPQTHAPLNGAPSQIDTAASHDEDLFEAEMADTPAPSSTANGSDRPNIKAHSLRSQTRPSNGHDLRADVPDDRNGHDLTKASEAETQPMTLGSASSPILLSEPHMPAPANGSAKPNGHPTEWRDIIADIGQSDAPMPPRPTPNPPQPRLTPDQPLPRETTAQELISRLQDSGIPLPTAFKSRDKKKIAAAARKDEKARRKVTRNVAGGEVDRVANRLNKDDRLMQLAQNFVTAEEAEALQTLNDTGNSGRHASPRLSAYLLVDAALAPMNRRM